MIIHLAIYSYFMIIDFDFFVRFNFNFKNFKLIGRQRSNHFPHFLAYLGLPYNKVAIEPNKMGQEYGKDDNGNDFLHATRNYVKDARCDKNL